MSWAVRAGLGPAMQLDKTVSMQDHLSSDISWVWGSQYHSQFGCWLERITGLTEGCCTYCYGLLEGKDQVKINQRKRHIGQSPGEFQMQSFHWFFFLSLWNQVMLLSWCQWVRIHMERHQPRRLTLASVFRVFSGAPWLIGYPCVWSHPPDGLTLCDLKPCCWSLCCGYPLP